MAAGGHWQLWKQRCSSGGGSRSRTNSRGSGRRFTCFGDFLVVKFMYVAVSEKKWRGSIRVS